MLLMSFSPYRLVTQNLLHLGEKVQLFIVMVRLDKTEPREGVADEVCLVCFLNMGSLEVDCVEATDDGVVQQTHMSSPHGEDVSLNRPIRQ